MVIKEDGIQFMTPTDTVNQMAAEININKDLFVSYSFGGRESDNLILLSIKPQRVFQFIRPNLNKTKYMKIKLSTKELVPGKGKEPVLEFVFAIVSLNC